jgi:hypothetical protein
MRSSAAEKGTKIIKIQRPFKAKAWEKEGDGWV